MESYAKMLHATRFVGGTLLTIGLVIFLYGVFVSGFNVVIGIGFGVVMGAVFIFLIGLFLVVSEEMVINSRRCKKESV